MVMAIQLILGLGLLVFLHELGHFLFARMFGMRVEKFVIFMDLFGVKLFKFKRGETEYSIGWLPIGGYVKISGMVDESLDGEQLKQEPQPWEFRSFAAWKRILVLLGGVIVNLIVGVIIFAGVLLFLEKDYTPISSLTNGVYVYEPGKDLGLQSGDVITHLNGEELVRLKDATPKDIFDGTILTVKRKGKSVDVKLPPQPRDPTQRVQYYTFTNYDAVIDSVVPKSLAAKAGVKRGDQFLALNDDEIKSFGDIENTVTYLQPKVDSFDITVKRNQEVVELTCVLDSTRQFGIISAGKQIKRQNYNIGNAFYYGYKESIQMLVLNMKGLAALFTGKIEVSKSVTGPIGIAKIYGSEFDALRFWRITGLISLVLAIMNLIPIPALDGGQILIIMIESVIGRDLSDRVKMAVQIAGIVIVVGLMVFTIVNDIVNF